MKSFHSDCSTNSTPSGHSMYTNPPLLSGMLEYVQSLNVTLDAPLSNHNAIDPPLLFGAEQLVKEREEREREEDEVMCA